jgi:hypothetical protein
MLEQVGDEIRMLFSNQGEHRLYVNKSGLGKRPMKQH